MIVLKRVRVYLWICLLEESISITASSTGHLVGTVNGCGGGCWWWLSGTHNGVITRSGTTVDIFSVATPFKNLVENPWKSVSREWFALLVRNCSLRAIIVERAGLANTA